MKESRYIISTTRAMKMVICLMGYLCNGKYELFKYLVEAYNLSPYKSYTTRKRRLTDQFNLFKYVSINEFIKYEGEDDLIAERHFKGYHYGKRLSQIPEGISVCVIDYNGYKALSKHVDTLGILINRKKMSRYQDVYDCRKLEPGEFLEYEMENIEQYQDIKTNDMLIRIDYENWTDIKLEIDDIMSIYIDDIK